jgi:hypothetical protein
MHRFTRGLAASTALFLPTSAFAHGGHLGELAGHSHWIGVAALAGAAAIAAVIASKGRKKDAADGEAEQEPAVSDETEAAQ